MFTCQNEVLTYSYIRCIRLFKRIIRQPDIEKSGSLAYNNIKSEQKCQVGKNVNQVRTSMNFAMKHKPQTYLNNDTYNNSQSEMCIFKQLGSIVSKGIIH